MLFWLKVSKVAIALIDLAEIQQSLENKRDRFHFCQSRWRDLNPRPLDYESSALPLSHIGTHG